MRFLPNFLRNFSLPRNISSVTREYSVSSYRNEIALKLLSHALQEHQDLELSPVRLRSCHFGTSFSSENSVEITDYATDRRNVNEFRDICYDGEAYIPILQFEDIFKRGYESLNSFIAKGCQDVEHEAAFFALKTYLSQIEQHEQSLVRKVNGREQNIFEIHRDLKKAGVAGLLTHHLLSCLVPGSNYVMSYMCDDMTDDMCDDTDNDVPYRLYTCPCLDTVNCLEKISYGPTGLGHEKIWFGHPDIILTSQQNFRQIVLVEDEIVHGQGLSDDNTDTDMFERQTSLSETRIITQAISFSLYQSQQRKFNPDPHIPEVTLIPVLLLSPSSYRIYMYDYKYDVLLKSELGLLWCGDRSESGELCRDGQFSMSAVLQIWMVLNHMTFIPCLSPKAIKLLQNSSNFYNICKQNDFAMPELAENILMYKSSFLSPKPERRKFRRLSIGDYSI